MINSVRSALQENIGIRIPVVALIFMFVGLRHDILRTLGFADAGLPLWITASVLAVVFILYTVLSTNEPPWAAVADRSHAVRFAYTILFLIACAAPFALVCAGVRFANPIFLGSIAVFAVMAVFDVTAKRRLKRRRPIAAK
jgi:hypothetical protein